MQYSLFPTPLGYCGIAWSGDTVIATRLPAVRPARTAASLVARTGAARCESQSTVRRAIQGITALLCGEKVDLTFICCEFAEIDSFETKVYLAVRAIPAGETRTYGAVAAQLGDRRLARRVGTALGRNPLPIIVPCHRVVGANHKLTGFSADGRVETKLRMLAIEGAQIGAAPGLFGELPLALKRHE